MTENDKSAENKTTDSPPKEITAANCYRLKHFDIRVGQSNLVYCKLCGRVIHVEFPALGIRK